MPNDDAERDPMAHFTPAAPTGPRDPRPAELIADGAVHGVGLLGGLAGGVALILIAASRGGAPEITVAIIYICGLFAMFGCSAAYNHWRTDRWRGLLQGLDHSAIFVMIAGSYTPFCVLFLHGAWAVGMTTLVWGVALAGIGCRLWTPTLFRRTRIVFYLTLGWIGLVAIGPLTGALGTATLVLLGLGGVLYSAGIIFHVWTSLPFQNAIWHGFVVAGASLHYVAVLNGVVLSAERLHMVGALTG